MRVRPQGLLNPGKCFRPCIAAPSWPRACARRQAGVSGTAAILRQEMKMVDDNVLKQIIGNAKRC